MAKSLNQLDPNRHVWPIFISYRRDECTRKVALWLKDELECITIEATTGQVFNLDVFVDVAEPHQSDFQANLVPHLTVANEHQRHGEAARQINIHLRLQQRREREKEDQRGEDHPEDAGRKRGNPAGIFVSM